MLWTLKHESHMTSFINLTLQHSQDETWNKFPFETFHLSKSFINGNNFPRRHIAGDEKHVNKDWVFEEFKTSQKEPDAMNLNAHYRFHRLHLPVIKNEKKIWLSWEKSLNFLPFIRSFLFSHEESFFHHKLTRKKSTEIFPRWNEIK